MFSENRFLASCLLTIGTRAKKRELSRSNSIGRFIKGETENGERHWGETVKRRMRLARFARVRLLHVNVAQDGSAQQYTVVVTFLRSAAETLSLVR